MMIDSWIDQPNHLNMINPCLMVNETIPVDLHLIVSYHSMI